MSTLAPETLAVAPAIRPAEPTSKPEAMRRGRPLRSLRICYLCADPSIPVGGSKGVSAEVRGLARALVELGHRVTLLSPRLGGPEPAGVPTLPIRTTELAESLGAQVPDELRRALGHLWNNVTVEQALESHLPRIRPDLLYERYSPCSAAGGAVARSLNIPHVLEVNAPLGWEGSEHREGAFQEAAQTLEEAALAQASRIIAASADLARSLIDRGVPEKKIAVVPNGVEVQLFRPVGTTVDLPPDRIVVGFVGSLERWHGLDVLARAFSRLGDDPRFHLLIVGDGPERRIVQALAERHPGRVTLAGAVPHSQVASYLRAMHVAVAPYPSRERFHRRPLKVLEYMAAGRAIVASRIRQLEALIEHGHTGVLVRPGDDEMLAGAIHGLAEDERHRRAMGMAAARSAWSGHRWTHRAEEILRAVEGVTGESLIAGHEGPPGTLEAGA